MKKSVKKFLSLVLILVISLGTMACGGEGHKHEYQWYLINSPTYEVSGSIEGICNCGAKTNEILPKLTGTPPHEHQFVWEIIKTPSCIEKGYLIGTCECKTTTSISIEKKDHYYENDICVSCKKKRDAVYLSENQKLGYGFKEISTLANQYGWANDENSVKTYLNNVSLSDIYLNILGNVIAKINNVFTANLTDIRCDFEIQTSNNRQIRGIKTENSTLYVVYNDGTCLEKGNIKTSENNLSNEKQVESIAINKQNQLLIVYDDREVEPCGIITTDVVQMDQSTLFFKENKLNGNVVSYNVCGALNINTDKIDIPKTHRGLPVVAISEYAFYEYCNLTEVTIPENIKTVDKQAFWGCVNLKKVIIMEGLEEISISTFRNCTELQEVVLPKSIKLIDLCAFFNCKKLKKINYAGSLLEFKNINIEMMNTPLLEAEEYVFNYAYKQN